MKHLSVLYSDAGQALFLTTPRGTAVLQELLNEPSDDDDEDEAKRVYDLVKGIRHVPYEPRSVVAYLLEQAFRKKEDNELTRRNLFELENCRGLKEVAAYIEGFADDCYLDPLLYILTLLEDALTPSEDNGDVIVLGTRYIRVPKE